MRIAERVERRREFGEPIADRRDHWELLERGRTRWKQRSRLDRKHDYHGASRFAGRPLAAATGAETKRGEGRHHDAGQDQLRPAAKPRAPGGERHRFRLEGWEVP